MAYSKSRLEIVFLHLLKLSYGVKIFRVIYYQVFLINCFDGIIIIQSEG